MKPFVQRLGEGWVFFQPAINRLAVLNETAKTVLDLSSEGYAQEEIANAFAFLFGIPDEQASRDVRQVIAELGGVSLAGEGDRCGLPRKPADATSADITTADRLEDYGTFQFGDSRIRVLSTLPGFDGEYFTRFRHRSAADEQSADPLEISGAHSGYRLRFRGDVIEEGIETPRELLGRISEILLNLEYPDIEFFAYFHAAAVSRGGQSLLLPGDSGAGKSTLTGYLVANGFAYLGDDMVAMVEADQSLRPLPTCLSIKSGSWPILEGLYPVLSELPSFSRYDRIMRYIEPRQNYETTGAAPAPSAIVFPAYRAGEPTRLTPLPPLQAMTRLMGSVDLSSSEPETHLAQFIRFLEQTPAYELSYSELPGAMKAIEDLLEIEH